MWWVTALSLALGAGLVWNIVNSVGGLFINEVTIPFLTFFLVAAVMYTVGLYQLADTDMFRYDTELLATLQLSFFSPVFGLTWARTTKQRRGSMFFRSPYLGNRIKNALGVSLLLTVIVAGFMLVATTMMSQGDFPGRLPRNFNLVAEMIYSPTAIGLAAAAAAFSFILAIAWEAYRAPKIAEKQRRSEEYYRNKYV